jgi:hypothetical protein
VEQTKTTKEVTDKIAEDSDAIIWSSYKNHDNSEVTTRMTFFKMPCKVKPTDLGYKFNILLFHTPDDSDISMFSAILGDPKGYIENISKLGYHGMMFKDKMRSKKVIKELFTRVLRGWGFTEPQIKKAIKIG